MFKREAGIFAVHIPYNGGNPAQLALLSGQVDFNFDNLATAAPNIRSGKLKALAVTTAAAAQPARRAARGRNAQGLRDRHLVGPGRAGRHAARRGAAPEPGLRRGAELAGSEDPLRRPDGGAGAHHARGVRRFMRAELAKYEKVVKASGAKVD
jgi:hypothetical protein